MTSAPLAALLSPARAPVAVAPPALTPGQWRRDPTDGAPWYVAEITPTPRAVLLATDERDASGEWAATGGRNVPARLVATWALCEKEARTT